ncbi:MAG: sodium:solute symporter family transporter [Janthinobacterium lividum]
MSDLQNAQSDRAGRDARAHRAGSVRLSAVFAFLLFVPVATFFWLVAYRPASLAVPIGQGGPTSVWVVLGVGLISYATLLNGLYVLFTNRRVPRVLPLVAGLAVLALPARQAHAATLSGAAHHEAIGFFLILVCFTLATTWWAARRTHAARDFYSAGGHLSAAQNGLAIAGDTISAGAFLGLSGLIFANGFDGLVYATGYAVGYPLIGIVFADRVRNLGRFTFADVLAYRLAPGPTRALAASSTLVIAIFFLISQMVGAGQLVQLLFGIDYDYAEIVVGLLMVCYVIFGGMMATSWVQIVKAVLMLCIGAVISLLILSRFDWRYDRLMAAAIALHPKHADMVAPTHFAAAPLSTLSLGLAMFVGSAGLPHLLMRMFTVPNARTARTSMFYGVLGISAFFSMITIIGVGGVALVTGKPEYVLPDGTLRGGGNMAAVHLAHVVGGEMMLGLVAAVAFATIIAVVAGLTLSGAAAVSHDLYASVIRRGRANERTEVGIYRLATLVLGVFAVVFGIAFRQQNIAYLIGLVVGIAAASNFPLLLLSLYWRGLTTRGAVAGGCTGLALSVMLTVLGPSVWVKVLGHAAPIFPMDPPTLVALPAAFAVCIVVSLLDRSRRGNIDRAGFDEQYRRMQGDTLVGLVE